MVGNVVVADAMMSGGDGQPETLSGVTVTLGGEHAMGEIEETGMDGGFAFTGLRAGTYTVTISDFPEDVSFETVSVEVEVGVNKIGNADFTGHFIRTSAVRGEVIVDDEGRAGVTVTLSGGPSDENFTKTTNADGMYLFEDLRPGDYTVSISDYPVRDYEFAATSQDVSVDLGETGTVDFTGILLRTSSISGGVSVDGMGLGDIAVTLSGAADASTTTDAGGQYAFTGLAAGDYTVTIAVESNAYVFDSMSQDVTVGDDDPARVSFRGAHATTASVVGQLFLDELDKNGEQDAGEHPLAHAGIPVTLVGPGVNQFNGAVTGADGRFAIPNLRAGTYQLIVLIEGDAADALAAASVAYRGPTQGYTLEVGVGEREEQDIPFGITHTTVNFTVSLKSGDKMGDALPGASVQLYGANNAMVGDDVTGDDGSVAIRVARAMTSGNMVNAGVSADGYDVADGMTEVSWEPLDFATLGANANDIVNLNVNLNISGATVTTAHPGSGMPLAGWEIDVMMGDDAVAGAPTALGDDGSVPFTTTVASVPATFTFAAAEDQDDELDGGENYESSGGTYTHDGLSVAGKAMDADPIVVRYTTQTLKVYVYEELDQAHGYTGNVGYGDDKKSDLVNLEIRVPRGNDSGFTRALSSEMWVENEEDDDDGGYTFRHLPANEDIVVLADAREGYVLLDPRRLDTYRDFHIDDNGVTGGAFGDEGGWGHTVSLCRLKEIDPTDQDFDECGSFAVVALHDVDVTVSKQAVETRGDAFRLNHSSKTFQSGITVSLTPVEGKNLAGDGGSFTTVSKDDPRTADIDERRRHEFDDMEAGAYTLDLPDGWMGMVDDDEADDALDPLEKDIDLDITPSTATLYGFVTSTNNNGFGLQGVTVHVNGQTAETDSKGRYIVTGIPNNMTEDQLFVHASRPGYRETKTDSTNNPGKPTTYLGDRKVPGFAANTLERYDISLYGSTNTFTVSGRVTEQGTNTGIKSVSILVDGEPPLNATGTGSSRKLTTGDDGSYTAVVEAKRVGETVSVSPRHSDYTFLPPSIPVAAIAGLEQPANFIGSKTYTITGKVIAPDGGPMKGVAVLAFENYADGDEYDDASSRTGTVADSTMTLSGGIFSLSVGYGSFTVRAKVRDDITRSSTDPTFNDWARDRKFTWFEYPNNGSVVGIPGQPSRVFGDINARSVVPRITVRRLTLDVSAVGTVVQDGTNLIDLEPTQSVEVRWQYDTEGRDVATQFGHSGDPTITVATVAPTPAAVSTTAGSSTNRNFIPSTVTTDTDAGTYTQVDTLVIGDGEDAGYGDITVTVQHTAVARTGVPSITELPGEAVATSDLDAVTTNVKTLNVDRNGDVITPTWFATASPGVEFRIALYVQTGDNASVREWVEVPTDDDLTSVVATVDRNVTRNGATWGQWSIRRSEATADPVLVGINLDQAADGWGYADRSGTVGTVTAARVKAATMLRVDSQADGGEWVDGPTFAIPSG